ncbi:MAG: potassium transporter Kup [Shewanella sp.]
MTITGKKTKALLLPALGVVYGDIGTSPLYAIKETFSGHTPILPTEYNVLGILSLIFWTITIIVSLKYIIVVLMADNKGEGGIMTLASLASKNIDEKYKSIIAIIGLIGAALFLGDAIITPAMSVLSAMEGVTVFAPSMSDYILPMSVAVLSVLFIIQRHGTDKVGSLFGPIILVWFLSMAFLGAVAIVRNPDVIYAINPKYAIEFIQHSPTLAFLSLGSVVLCVTGAEALYADMGHFGRKPVRIAWSLIVMPALLLNYFGQGVILLDNPSAIKNPFFHLAPSWAIIPLVFIATMATVIASQSVISGAYSLARQAIQLGYFPRKLIIHTSDNEIGQIYLPFINYSLFASVISVVLVYQSSSNLAAAYGIAVTGTMLITTLLLILVAYKVWNVNLKAVILLSTPILIIDILFFSSNALKIFSGGALPIVIGVFVFSLMLSWKRGRSLVSKQLEGGVTITSFIKGLDKSPVITVSGNAAFLTGSTKYIPFALLHNLKHNKVMHENVYLLTIKTEDIPYVSSTDKIETLQTSERFTQVIAHYGYKQTPNMMEVLSLCRKKGIAISMENTSFFLSRETIINQDDRFLFSILNKLFIWLHKNALQATEFFNIPSNRVVELGAQVELTAPDRRKIKPT